MYFASLDSSTQRAIIDKNVDYEHSANTYHTTLDGLPSSNVPPFLAVSHLYSKDEKHREWYIHVDLNSLDDMIKLTVRDENKDFPVIMSFLEEYLKRKLLPTAQIFVHTNIRKKVK